MANPVCLSPLKFYDTLEKQERYKSYAYGRTVPVVMPLNVIYPFQFIVSANTSQITQVYICDARTNTRRTSNIADTFSELGLTVLDIKGYKITVFSGILPVLDIKHKGSYYLEVITDTESSYYSEIFCFTTRESDYLEIEYWNPEGDFQLVNGLITFANNFHFKVLLPAELGKPEYLFEEEATRRLGYSFIESQVSKKVYKFNTVLPEYLCDALRLIRLCSHKQLTCKGETYDMLSFNMDVDWQEQGDLASVNCEFEVDNIIVNLGGFQHELLGGDFNDAYNNDFKKQSTNL